MVESTDGVPNSGFVLEQPSSVRFRSVDTSPASSSDLSGHLAVSAKRGTFLAIVLGAAPPIHGKEAEDQENCDTYKDQTKYGAHDTPSKEESGSHPWL